MYLEVPPTLQIPPTNPRKDPRRGNNGAQFRAREGKNAKCWLPTLRASHLSGCGAPPSCALTEELAEVEHSQYWPNSRKTVAEVDHPKIGRSRNWPISKLTELRNWPKSKLAEVDRARWVSGCVSGSVWVGV